MSKDTYKILVQQMTEDRAKDAGLKDVTKAWELVVNALIMAPYDLSVDEIEAGITDGGADGQIDAMYVIVNGMVLNEEAVDNKTIPEKGPLEIDIVIIQSKYTESFEENPLKSVRATVRDLFSLSKDYSAIAFKEYNSSVQSKFALARFAVLSSSGRAATIKCRVYYATRGSNANIHHSVLATGTTLAQELGTSAATKDAEIVYLGAEQVIDLSRMPQIHVRQLAFQEQLSHDENSFACLVPIDGIISFLSDNSGNLIRSLFDANVRDFLGTTTDVNEGIYQTLETLGDEDFWWYNNGVTLVADTVDPKGKHLALTDPLLVNGLQTCNVIHSFMSSPDVSKEAKKHIGEKRILVRIIRPTSDAVRDGIIRATNSQTHIPKPYLRGMDRVHRNIEDFFRKHGLFYERRKNQYRNEEKPRSSIVTLTEMSQSLVAALLFRGGDARGRPTTLINDDKDYQTLFSESYPLDTFLSVIRAKREIMNILTSIEPPRGAGFRNNVVWHALAFVSGVYFHNTKHAASGWATLEIDAKWLPTAVAYVVEQFDKEGGTDGVAKSPGFQEAIAAAAASVRSPPIVEPAQPTS
ncbi:MAG: AIPR family protein [Allorhizobium sp.]